jgi:hypothetical protein
MCESGADAPALLRTQTNDQQDAAVSIQHPREVGQGHVVDRCVSADSRYMKLMGGGFLCLEDTERAAFTAALRSDAEQVSADEIEALLGYEWHSRLTAAWMLGITRRVEWRDHIAALLRLDSRLGTSHAEQFVVPDGPWERWVNALPHTRGTSSMWAARERKAIDSWCDHWEL